MIPAQLVGGPAHGEKIYVERARVRIVEPSEATRVVMHQVSTSLPEVLTVKYGTYTARRTPQRLVYDVVAGLVWRSNLARLGNGMVPFDWAGWDQ